MGKAARKRARPSSYCTLGENGDNATKWAPRMTMANPAKAGDAKPIGPNLPETGGMATGCQG